MQGLLLDTHACVWYLSEPEKISSKAIDAIDKRLAGGLPLYISAISLIEIVYLGEKGRIGKSATQKLIDVLSDASVFTIVPVDLSVVRALTQISREAIPDMPDRIITATGLALNIAIITMDKRIASSQIQTIW